MGVASSCSSAPAHGESCLTPRSDYSITIQAEKKLGFLSIITTYYMDLPLGRVDYRGKSCGKLVFIHEQMKTNFHMKG